MASNVAVQQGSQTHATASSWDHTWPLSVCVQPPAAAASLAATHADRLTALSPRICISEGSCLTAMCDFVIESASARLFEYWHPCKHRSIVNLQQPRPKRPLAPDNTLASLPASSSCLPSGQSSSTQLPADIPSARQAMQANAMEKLAHCSRCRRAAWAAASCGWQGWAMCLKVASVKCPDTMGQCCSAASRVTSRPSKPCSHPCTQLVRALMGVTEMPLRSNVILF